MTVRSLVIPVGCLVLLAADSARGAEEAGGAKDALPPAEELVGALKSYLTANSPELVGTRVSIRLGRAQPRPMKLKSLDAAGGATVIETTRGGRTELLGGQNYFSWTPPKENDPMFVVEDASLSFTIGCLCFVPALKYEYLVKETRGGETRYLTPKEADVAGRGHAGCFPLVTAYRGR